MYASTDLRELVVALKLESSSSPAGNRRQQSVVDEYQTDASHEDDILDALKVSTTHLLCQHDMFRAWVQEAMRVIEQIIIDVQRVKADGNMSTSKAAVPLRLQDAVTVVVVQKTYFTVLKPQILLLRTSSPHRSRLSTFHNRQLCRFYIARHRYLASQRMNATNLSPSRRNVLSL